MSDRTALITGISGQDGSYLAELLLQKGCVVVGTSRTAGDGGPNLSHLKNRIRILQTNYEQDSLISLLHDIRPTDIYNFAGQTYVGKSWTMVDDTFRASAYIPANLLEAIVRVDRDIRYFQASSAEIFSLNWERVCREDSPIAPGSPYGCSKAYAHNMVACYRRNYGLFAVNGILFQHESPRRHENFASRKIVKAAVAIKRGLVNEIVLGNLDVSRDWSYAPDTTRAIEKMVGLEAPQDLVICSGNTHSVREVAEVVFGLLDLEFDDYYRIDNSLVRAWEPPVTRGSNEAAQRILGWKPKTAFREMLEKMVDYEFRLQSGAETDFGNERPFE